MEIILFLLLFGALLGVALYVLYYALIIALVILLVLLGLIGAAFLSFKRYLKTLPPPRAPGTPRSGKEIAENILLSVVLDI